MSAIDSNSSSTYIGVMSGTSLDAVDAILVNFSQSDMLSVESHYQHAIPAALRESLLELCSPGYNEIKKLAKLDNLLAELYVKTIQGLLSQAGISPSAVTAVGLHGQTIRHLPEHSNSIQLGNPNVVAYQTGIPIVADVRRKDMAAKGQGAPLVPAFHQHIFHSNKKNRVVVNIGGIANVSGVPCTPQAAATGFDTGPGNLLLDAWCQAQLDKPYDHQGQWAASGVLVPKLLSILLSHPFFQLTPPKSTGRETFNIDWLNGILANCEMRLQPEDVQHTLVHLTAHTIQLGIDKLGLANSDVIICGGGANNVFLLSTLTKLLKEDHSLHTSSEFGIDPQHVESMMMAWLGKQRIMQRATQVASATGAQADLILGCVYLPG